MANTALSGPRRIIELDGKPSSEWELDLKASYAWKGKLWNISKFGCCICADDDDNPATFFCEEDDHYRCVKHGPLMEVPYLAERWYTIKIGDVERKGKDCHEDVLLFPADFSGSERNDLINDMLNLAEAEENDSQDE